MGGKSSKNSAKAAQASLDQRYPGDPFQRAGVVVASTKNCDIIRTPCKPLVHSRTCVYLVHFTYFDSSPALNTDKHVCFFSPFSFQP
ncbi:hypothetical protein Ocin01_15949 [Orchesella cincta]|uniref:Uncharacterized protein n=1 Tax=Orchesella cincta TaxID=48709 RepID=A0A1D2MCN9_ORCCI|nr:hypothetical protein Ocin01_15949 [Orchesella cincta]